MRARRLNTAYNVSTNRRLIERYAYIEERLFACLAGWIWTTASLDHKAAPDKAACARMLEANGVDYIIVHTGYDERHETPGLSPLDDLDAVVQAVGLPVQAVGGLSLEQAVQTPGRRAPLVVIGAPLAVNDAAFHAAGGDVEAVLREVVRRVKA